LGFVLYRSALGARRFAGFFEMEFEPKIIAMVCTYCTYTAADMAGSLRLQYPHNVRIIKYLCTGKVDIQHMLKAFEGGADALLVGG
jgi:F420-non-reducing hydrogenase iron-sulfur subunit